ncbi:MULTISPECIES: hypothetical protein [Entomomonas]|uniref:Uncharacterized protein n=1 Tax=Entomomonas asaccharolytica TaxID=2785331 RepID=A0A974RY37_9GAMM|nr:MULTISPECIES: hypothetical protein [Entomomonas]QQP86883.1 hypothetical protein JHT90_06470 [Entomomonas asaccharolytica]UYZ83499.1 hypothetical protein MTZ49_12985 [Entomomonas sp. E2T0]
MSRVIVALTETGYSPIADSLYEYIQLHVDMLPEEDEVIALFKENAGNLSEYGHKLNRLFIERVQHILLSGVFSPNKEQAKKLLRVEEIFCEEDSSKDSFKISFAGITYQDPTTEELEALDKIIVNYSHTYLQGNVEVANTYTLSVPAEVVTKIKEIDTDGICEQIVDYSCGVSSTHIIETGYLRESGETLGHQALEYYDAIWKIISDYIPNFMEIKGHKPDFLVLYVSYAD